MITASKPAAARPTMAHFIEILCRLLEASVFEIARLEIPAVEDFP